MRRASIAALCAVAGIAAIVPAASAVATQASPPKLVMLGNTKLVHGKRVGVCSLSTHKTFQMRVTGVRSGTEVQFEVQKPNGDMYVLPGVGKTEKDVADDHGQHDSNKWPCYPAPGAPGSDKVGLYRVWVVALYKATVVTTNYAYFLVVR